MTLPIDDVWLAGESMVGVPGQRMPHTDTNSMANGSNGAPMNSHNGHDGTDPNVPSTRSSNGRPPEFDPRSFDPGPDLPPLPTLRPLPTIKPMATWPPVDASAPVSSQTPAQQAVAPEPPVATEPTAAAEPVGAPTPEPAVASAAPDDDRTIRVSGVTEGGVGDIVAGPVEPTPAIRHRRRAAELDDPAPEAEPTSPNSGRRVLVLGGSGMVGGAIARSLAEQGARVAVHHATRGPLAGQLVADLPGAGHLSVGADLADADAVAELISSVDAQFDGLDVVINAASAGDSVGRPAVVGSTLSEWTDAWTGTLTVDVLGAATVVHAAAAAFISRGRSGRIILVAAKGRTADGRPSAVATATEQAVGALGSALAAELKPHGVVITVVGSGSGSAAGWSPEALAETVVWLAAGPSASLPGAVFTIAG